MHESDVPLSDENAPQCAFLPNKDFTTSLESFHSKEFSGNAEFVDTTEITTT
jgi:hypothetical protein